jgi:hypothetical protein
VKAKLRDPDSAKFEGLQLSRKAGPPIVCGYVNSRNGMGGMSERQRFVSAGEATFLEEEMADGEMAIAWSRAC